MPKRMARWRGHQSILNLKAAEVWVLLVRTFIQAHLPGRKLIVEVAHNFVIQISINATILPQYTISSNISLFDLAISVVSDYSLNSRQELWKLLCNALFEVLIGVKHVAILWLGKKLLEAKVRDVEVYLGKTVSRWAVLPSVMDNLRNGVM
jgi:hypothetical protein